MNETVNRRALFLRVKQIVQFCIVGGSGVVVDMAVLFLLADPRTLAWNATVAKVLSAEVALTNNFWWNEVWTFRDSSRANRAGVLRRLLRFNAICGIGIGLAALLLHLFHAMLGLNLYVANLLAIVLVTAWNYGMNAASNWKQAQPPCAVNAPGVRSREAGLRKRS